MYEEVGNKNDKVLLVINMGGFYKIKDIFNTINKYNINWTLIPSGFTPLLQPFNTYINKSIKAYLFEIYDKYVK